MIERASGQRPRRSFLECALGSCLLHHDQEWIANEEDMRTFNDLQGCCGCEVVVRHRRCNQRKTKGIGPPVRVMERSGNARGSFLADAGNHLGAFPVRVSL